MKNSSSRALNQVNALLRAGLTNAQVTLHGCSPNRTHGNAEGLRTGDCYVAMAQISGSGSGEESRFGYQLAWV